MDEEPSEDSPDKKPQTSASKKDPEGQDQKWVKNVRRRVYDALNVLYAAGVLKKDGKHVSCDQSVIEMTRAIKSELIQTKEQDTVDSKTELAASSSHDATPKNAYEQQVRNEIQQL